MKSVFGSNPINWGILTGLFIILSFGLASISQAKETKLQGTIPVTKENQSEYTQLAKLSIQDAMVKSNKAVPGKIIEIVLEEEDGFLIYEAEIVGADKSTKEVVVDAGTGAVLQVKEKQKVLKQ